MRARQKAIRLNPEDADAYVNRGVAYRNLGQYQRAIEDYDQAIRLNPNFALAFGGRALVYTLLGQDSQASRTSGER